MKQRARIKNWTAALRAEEYMAATREALKGAGARKITFERASKAGPVMALTFERLADTTLYRFRMAPDGERATAAVMESSGYVSLTSILEEQVYRTTWANVRDYVVISLALVKLGGHSFEQVFFPFLLSEEDGGGRTYFEVFQDLRALPMAGASSASPVTIIDEVEVL